jgi:hypothetical protein
MTLVHGTPERLVTLERNFDNDSAIGPRRSLAPDRSVEDSRPQAASLLSGH